MPAKVENISKCYLRNEEQLMKRLNQMVSGNDCGPFKKDSGYQWQLDGSNDWWASIEGNTLIVEHRYRQEKADALAALCKVLFQDYV